MGVSYPNDPQSNLAWFREQFASLSKGIADATALARQSTRGGGTVGGSLLLTGPVTLSGVQLLQRRGKMVSGQLSLTLTAAVGQYGVLAQLPPGFRPDPSLNFIPVPCAVSSWTSNMLYIDPVGGVIRPLLGTIPSGSTVAFTIPPFAAAA